MYNTLFNRTNVFISTGQLQWRAHLAILPPSLALSLSLLYRAFYIKCVPKQHFLSSFHITAVFLNCEKSKHHQHQPFIQQWRELPRLRRRRRRVKMLRPKHRARERERTFGNIPGRDCMLTTGKASCSTQRFLHVTGKTFFSHIFAWICLLVFTAVVAEKPNDPTKCERQTVFCNVYKAKTPSAAHVLTQPNSFHGATDAYPT